MTGTKQVPAKLEKEKNFRITWGGKLWKDPSWKKGPRRPRGNLPGGGKKKKSRRGGIGRRDPRKGKCQVRSELRGKGGINGRVDLTGTF